MAVVLAAAAFAIGVLWNPVAGAAMGAVALFVALRPLFHTKAERAARKRAPPPP